MRSRIRRFATRAVALLIVLAIMPAPAPLAAQSSQTGILTGTVSLPDGRVVANATVVLQQSDGSYPRTARTDERGEYRINFVAPGLYTVLVRQVGFREVSVEAVEVRATAVRRLDITLEVARPELRAVTVRAAPLPASPRTPEITFALSARERELLPAPRDANALVAFTPGARPEQIFGGSTAQANLYQLDGVTVNQPGTGGAFLLPNVDWIEDFRVIGLGAGAEYGNFQGGLVNIVTKSGSNTTRAQFRTFYENRALNRSNVNAFEDGAELETRLEFSGELRGPIVRDRLYYFVSGQEARSGQRVVDFSSATPGTVAWIPTLTERREQKVYGKLTWQAGANDIVNLSVGLDNVARERVGLSGFNSIDAAVRGRSPSRFYQANWQRTLRDDQFLEVKFSGYVGEDNELPYNGAGFPAVSLLDAPNTPQFANATYTRRNAPSSHGLSARYDRHVAVGRVRHHLKLGGELVLGTWREQRTRNGGLSWYTEAGPGFDPLVPATWQEIPSLGVYATADTGGRIDLDASTTTTAAYLQDDIRLSDRLTLNAGLRLGQWTGFITPGNGGGSRGETRFRALSATGLDPRVGATFDVQGDGRLLAKAHWGRFHQNLFALFFDRAPGANVFTDIEYCDWNDRDKSVLPELGREYGANSFNALFTCFPGANLFNEAREYEDYRQPHVDQLTLGVEKAIGTRLRAEAVFVTRRNRAVLALVDRRLERNWLPVANVRAVESGRPVLDANGQELVLPTVYVRSDDLSARLRAGDVVPGYVAADTLRLGYSPDLVIRPVDDARRDFDQVQLSLAGAWPRLSFHASLAWTNLTGNLFSVNGYFDPTGQGSGPFVEPNTQLNSAGRLGNFAPWDFRLRMSGQLPWGFEGGAFLALRAGDFWTPTLEVDRGALSFRAEAANGQLVDLDSELFRNAGGQTILVEARGSRQLEAVANLDLRVQKVLSVGAQDLIVGVEVFNLLNGAAAADRNRLLNRQDPTNPASLVGAVRLRQPPTTLRLNVQVRR